MAVSPEIRTGLNTASIGGRGSFVGPKPGSFESIRLINPNSFPVRGESKTQTPSFRFEPLRPRQLNAIRAQSVPEDKSNVIQFPEVSQAKPVEKAHKNPTRGEIIFFPGVRPVEVRPIPRSVPSIEYQRLATRIRTARLMAVRQARVIPSTEVSVVSQPQTEPVVQTQTVPEQKVFSQRQTQQQAVNRSESLVGTKRAIDGIVEGQRRKVIAISAVDKDHRTNRDRVIALEAAFDSLQAESGEDSVDGDRLGDRAAIEEDKFKSEYFTQVKTPRRTDHSQKRTRIHLKEKPVKKSDIPLIVELHTAIRKADRVPIDPPTDKQFHEAIVPPDQIIAIQADEQVFLKKEMVYEEPSRITLENNEVGIQAIINETTQQELTRYNIPVSLQLNHFIEAGLMFSMTRLDSRVDNDIAIAEREELFKIAA